MQITPTQYLPADLAQVKNAKEFKRFNFFGFRFGPSKVKELALATVETQHGPVLQAKVRIGNSWQPVSDLLLASIAVRHIALAVHTAALSVTPPAPALIRRNALSGRPRAVSAPEAKPAGAALQRRNAFRRSPSAPPAYVPTEASAVTGFVQGSDLGSAGHGSLHRAASIRSNAANVETWDEASSSATLTPIFSRTSTSTSMSTVDLNEVEPDSTIGRYLSHMALHDTYGTDTEVVALSRALQRPITVVGLNSRVVKDGKTAPPAITIYHRDDGRDASHLTPNNGRIYLLFDATKQKGTNSDSNHYRPLRADKLTGKWTKRKLRKAAGESASDGSCLFDSVAMSIGGNHTAASMRALAVSTLKQAVFQHDEQSKAFVVAMTVEDSDGLNKPKGI